MVTARVLAEIALKHRAFHVAVSDSGHVAALTRLGSGSLITPDFGSVTAVDFSLEAKGAVLSPAGTQLAITGAQSITVFSTLAFEAVHQWSGSFDSCWFDSSNHLWTCKRLESDLVSTEVWEPDNWKRIAETTIRDPYGDSYFWLRPHPNPNWVVMWAAAGQNGQCLFWAGLEDKGVEAIRFPDLDETTWPSFNERGDEFLVVSLGEIRRYGYPSGPLHARMQVLPGSGEDRFGDFIYYTDSRRALVSSQNSRLFLVDVENMEVEHEIAIPGHEPRPTFELYPRLKGDRALASDLSFLIPLPGGSFLSVHKETGASEAKHGYDRLAMWQLLPGLNETSAAEGPVLQTR